MPYKIKFPSAFVSVFPITFTFRNTRPMFAERSMNLRLLQSTSTPYSSFIVINNNTAGVQTYVVGREVYKFN
jgi:hypothetical protein